MTNSPATPSLEQSLERFIQDCSSQRVQDLRIERVGHRMFVHGRTQTYHHKQLVLLGVMGALGSTAMNQVEIDIQVGEQ